MNKVLKFNRFSTKRRIIQFLLILIVVFLFSVYTFNRVSRLLNQKRVETLIKYQAQVVTLKEDKEENLKKIEEKYDEKIDKLVEKIHKLEEKIK